MKHLIIIISLGFFIQGIAWSQGTIILGPGPNQSPSPPQACNLNFSAISNSPAGGLPSGSANYYGLGYFPQPPDLASNVLIANVNITLLTHSTVVPNLELFQMEADVSLTPIAPFTSVYATSYVPVVVEPDWVIFYPQSYSSALVLQLTGNQVQILLAGQFYVEVNTADGGYLSQLTTVPEPSSVTLIFLSFGVFILLLQKNRPPFPAS